MPNKDIIQEFSDLGSNLGNISKNIYSVPPGYFDGFSEQLLGFIKASETLSSLPKEMPFNVPAGYFDRELKSGAGVVADDLVAGVYANLVVRMLT